jgi:TRAP-type C4-dicarboxylate transport system substrate-binding protein
LNIRVSPRYLQAIKGLGGNPVVIPPTEVYAALERNVVDGYCWPSVGIRDWGWHKQTKYVIDPGFYTGSLLPVYRLRQLRLELPRRG